MTTSETVQVCAACTAGEVVDGVCQGCGVVAGAPANAGPALLTSSRLRCFRTCPRLHQYLYVEGWRPAREPEYFRVGTLVHAGLEAWWLACQDVHEGELADGSQLGVALATVAGQAMDAFEQVRVEEMLRAYHLRWGADAPKYEVIAVEKSFVAPLLNPQTWRASRTWQLAGKVDAIVRRREDDRVLVVEHKTTGEEIGDDAAPYWSTLALDHQCSAYVIGAESLGHQVDEILYDVLRKPQQEQLRATPIESRKYRQPKTPEEKTWAPNDPRLLYAAQRDRDESPDEYRARVREKIDLDLNRFARRVAVPRTESQIKDYLADAWQQGRAMADLQAQGFAPRNPEACHRFGTCSMWLACSTGSHPSSFPADYARTDNVNPELTRRD